MNDIFHRLVEIRDATGKSQKEFGELLNVHLRTIQNYEAAETKNIPHAFIEILVEKLNIDANWLITGVGKPYKTDSNIFDDTILPKFELLKISCQPEEYDRISQDVIEDMTEVIDRRVADSLVNDLMKRVNKTPLFEKVKGLIIMNEIGATVRIWNIIAIAADDQSELSPKEKLINAVKNGTFLVPQSRSERELLVKFVENWNDEICIYLFENSAKFTETLKKVSTKIESAISSNQKILELVKKVKNYLDR